jgi:hypothetical protein
MRLGSFDCAAPPNLSHFLTLSLTSFSLPPPQGGGGGQKKASLVGEEDADMDPTQYFNNRTIMLKRLEAEGITVYPHK